MYRGVINSKSVPWEAITTSIYDATEDQFPHLSQCPETNALILVTRDIQFNIIIYLPQFYKIFSISHL